jgi:hypothetical protein
MFAAIPAASDKNGTGGILDASLSVDNTIEVTSNETSTVSEPDSRPVSDVPTLSFASCMEELEEARILGRVFVGLVMVCWFAGRKGKGTGQYVNSPRRNIRELSLRLQYALDLMVL